VNKTLTIAQKLLEIKNNIARLEAKYGREPGSVFLLAVCKGQPIVKVSHAWQAGQHAFGESYVNEAVPRIIELNNEAIEWHFIGPIQSNKTRKISQYFSWVHSVANFKVATRLNEQRPVHLPPLNICIEVNISHETTKSGIEPGQLLLLAKHCLALPNLKLRGLMTLPALENDLILQREAFYKLVVLKRQLEKEGIYLDTLSMGMTNDYEAAIAEGATMVRIGTAIFGPREH
jgi:pyridoxal phosphate enzyme (YggS family)